MQWVEEHIKEPVAKVLMQLGVTPNALTVSGVIVTMLSGIILVITRNVGLAGLVFLLGVSADLFDGALARHLQSNHNFRFGGWLDTMCDRISETILLGVLTVFYFTAVADLQVSFAAYAAGFLSTYAKAAAGEKKLIVHWDERAIFGYPGRVAILASGMISTMLIPFSAEEVMRYAVMVLFLFNAVVLALRLYKVFKVANAKTS